MITKDPSRSVRLLHVDESVAVSQIGPICVVIWRGPVMRTPFDLQVAGLADVVANNPDGAGFLCIIETSAKPPEDELRRASADMVAAHGGRLRCVACVIEGQGFRPAMNRAALAGMALLFRNRKTEASVFATNREAADWLKQHLDVGTVAEFVASVEQVRASLPALRST